MNSLNKVQVIGGLGKDPETRYTNDSKPICNLSLATSETWKDKTGQKQEKTEWHRVVVFGKIAETVEKYLKKGSRVYFEGKLQTRKWKDSSGQDRYSTEIVVDMGGRMIMLDGKESDSCTPAKATPAPAQETTSAPFDDDAPF